MVYKNTLPNSKKDKLFPIKLEEQNCCCILCKKPFEDSIFWEQSTHFDHLDRNENNHDPNNLAIVHIECNYIKKWYAEYQVRALDWKKYLESCISSSLCVSVGEKKNESEQNPHIQQHTQTDELTDELTDGQINLIINKLTKSQLEEQVPLNSTKQISFSAILADIHYLTIQETGSRGSEPAARRALNGMTRSKFSPWQQKKLGQGNIIIQRREKIQDKKKLPDMQKKEQEGIS